MVTTDNCPFLTGSFPALCFASVLVATGSIRLFLNAPLGGTSGPSASGLHSRGSRVWMPGDRPLDERWTGQKNTINPAAGLASVPLWEEEQNSTVNALHNDLQQATGLHVCHWLSETDFMKVAYSGRDVQTSTLANSSWVVWYQNETLRAIVWTMPCLNLLYWFVILNRLLNWLVIFVCIDPCSNRHFILLNSRVQYWKDFELKYFVHQNNSFTQYRRELHDGAGAYPRWLNRQFIAGLTKKNRQLQHLLTFTPMGNIEWPVKLAPDCVSTCEHREAPTWNRTEDLLAVLIKRLIKLCSDFSVCLFTLSSGYIVSGTCCFIIALCLELWPTSPQHSTWSPSMLGFSHVLITQKCHKNI